MKTEILERVEKMYDFVKDMRNIYAITGTSINTLRRIKKYV